jgi:hypothetical protein
MRRGKRLALSLRDLSALSRRDERTEPGVLTPGTDKRTVHPEGAVGWIVRRQKLSPNQSRSLTSQRNSE